MKTENKKTGRPTKQSIKNKKISDTLTKLDEKMLERLRLAFSLDCTIREAAFYCGVDESTYYNWKKKNKKLFEEIERLKDEPILKARKKVVDMIEDDVLTAKWYLERKRKNEFALKTEVEQKNINIDFEDLKNAKTEDLLKIINDTESKNTSY